MSKKIYSKRKLYETYIGKLVNGLTINSLMMIDGRMRFETICLCGKLFYPRAENIDDGRTKSCGCKRYDFVSQNNRRPESLERDLYRSYQFAAQRRNLEFSFTFEEFKQFLFCNCFYCNAPPSDGRIKKYKQGKRREQYLKYNGIDRIDNTVGYNHTNCVTCCIICNRAKGNMPASDFNNWLNNLCEYRSFK